MEKLLGYNALDLKNLRGYSTAKEIDQQPDIWLKAYALIKERQNDIELFIKKLEQGGVRRILLVGAGSSAFVGESLQPYLNKKLKANVEIIATTDIVSHPELYFQRETPTLLISFARSGNSPESLATCDLGMKMVDHLYQLILTCNPEGELAKNTAQTDDNLVLLMPIEANDSGFAMTGSFTSMLLSCYLVFNIDKLDLVKSDVIRIAQKGDHILLNNLNLLKALAEEPFERIIYLGAGMMKGLARESALKMLELTAGQIGTLFDSPLGFRHGPKSYINSKTLVVIYLSNDTHARQYELDLLSEIKQDAVAMKTIVITDHAKEAFLDLSDIHLSILGETAETDEDLLLVLPYLLNAQILSFYKSLACGIGPDNPSPSGMVNRVVQGVTIHAYEIA